MKFSRLLELDPSVVKPMIKQSKSAAERRRLWFVITVRSLVIVLLAIASIGLMSLIFGQQNTPLAVSAFCMILGLQFVSYDYSYSSSLWALAAILTIVVVVPPVAAVCGPVLGLIVNFAAFFSLLFLSCQRPEMGNGGLYNFVYVFMICNPVFGQVLLARAAMAVVIFCLGAAVLWLKHKDSLPKTTIGMAARQFRLRSETGRWMIRLSLGTAIALSLAAWLKIPRFMWLAFACASLLATYPCGTTLSERCAKRIGGAVLGTVLFCMLYALLPSWAIVFLGPLGGFVVGLCVDYRYKTMANCFGALSIAVSMFGMGSAATIRVADAALGALIAVFIGVLFERMLPKLEECGGEAPCQDL